MWIKRSLVRDQEVVPSFFSARSGQDAGMVLALWLGQLDRLAQRRAIRRIDQDAVLGRDRDVAWRLSKPRSCYTCRQGDLVGQRRRRRGGQPQRHQDKDAGNAQDHGGRQPCDQAAQRF